MALGRPKVALILRDDERLRLYSLAHRSRTAPHLARRARIILACAAGHDNTGVAKRRRMSRVAVCKWGGGGGVLTSLVRGRLVGSPTTGRAGDRAHAGRDAARGDPLERPGHGEGERA